MIEVGVDVPEASVMVIEHAERFGLAQLHQLRGRIGRGAERSTCLLLYKAPLGETAKARLAIMRETEDGFRIAEEDLRLRGEGDVLGTRQSGMPGFRVARLEVHGKLLERGARRRRADARARSEAALAARRGAARTCSICSRATRRSGCWARADDRRLAGRRQPRVGSPNRFGPSVPLRQNQMISTMKPTSGMKISKIHQPLRSISCSRRTADSEARQEYGESQNRRFVDRHSDHALSMICGTDADDEREQHPVPVFRPRRRGREIHVVGKSRSDRFAEVHGSPPALNAYLQADASRIAAFRRADGENAAYGAWRDGLYRAARARRPRLCAPSAPRGRFAASARRACAAASRVGARLDDAGGHQQRHRLLDRDVEVDHVAPRHVEEKAGGRIRRARHEGRDMLGLAADAPQFPRSATA